MTVQSSDDPEPDPPDWDLLASLFDAGSSFRHRMGLRRHAADDFYAPTAAATSIREEKRRILEAHSGLYTLSSAAGRDATSEFAGLLNLELPVDATVDALSLAIEPDLLFVFPPDWTLGWASVCFPTRWTLEGKLHEPLGSIHAVIPALNEQLGRQITTFLDRLAPGDGWRRANWGLSGSTRRDQHPRLPYSGLTNESSAEETYIRVEDQHFLKLPMTGAIAFGIRIASYRLSDVADRPDIRAGLAEKLRTMPEAVAKYKGLPAQLLA